ncbi:hypothetical protein [Loktanella sp. Alg231-35]|uniref:hypothetical protein n=1 Tax=Loktanella sp. Alg231-35 TaxID=1922220 RepID=UPI00131EE80F|nr:hypothetical protein [Loktanella sp. Alg231-35]
MSEQLIREYPTVRPLSERDPADRTLVIGNMRRWVAEGRLTSSLRDFTFLNFGELSAEALKAHTPDIILSPLVGDDFDVIEIAQQLATLAFSGRYRAIAERLPNAEMIRKEVSEQATDLDFDVLLMPRDPAERALREVSDHAQNAPHSLDNARQKRSKL